MICKVDWPSELFPHTPMKYFERFKIMPPPQAAHWCQILHQNDPPPTPPQKKTIFLKWPQWCTPLWRPLRHFMVGLTPPMSLDAYIDRTKSNVYTSINIKIMHAWPSHRALKKNVPQMVFLRTMRAPEVFQGWLVFRSSKISRDTENQHDKSDLILKTCSKRFYLTN